MKKYQVGVKIYNSFEVEADSEEEAEQKVREMDLYDTFEHCDYNICYVDEVLDSVKLSPDEEAQIRGEHHTKHAMSDARALHESTGGRIYQSDGTLDYSKICDDEHGNTL
jgi:hypothetical protein